MSIAIIVTDRNLDNFLATLKNNYEEEIQVYPHIKRPEDIEIAVVWKQPLGYLKRFTNLKLICSFGAGVDHIINDPDYNPNIPITRIVDDDLTNSMCQYVLAAVSMFQYGFSYHFDDALKENYHRKRPHNPDLTIGILGLGALGRATAEICAQCGYRVLGISKSKKEIIGVETFTESEMSSFLNLTNILVCMLPLTNETENIIDLNLFLKLNRPSFFINVGRGQQVCEEDLIQAIEEELLLGACLDVVKNEPIQVTNPLLNHPRIIITPHVASITDQKKAAIQIIDNIKRLQKGEELNNKINVKKGY